MSEDKVRSLARIVDLLTLAVSRQNISMQFIGMYCEFSANMLASAEMSDEHREVLRRLKGSLEGLTADYESVDDIVKFAREHLKTLGVDGGNIS